MGVCTKLYICPGDKGDPWFPEQMPFRKPIQFSLQVILTNVYDTSQSSETDDLYGVSKNNSM